jgi:hypothetical protein
MGRPPKVPRLTPEGLAPLVQGWGLTEAGAALRLAAWANEGHAVPFEDLPACCAVAHAVSQQEKLAVARVVDNLWTPADVRDARDAENVTQRDAHFVTHSLNFNGHGSGAVQIPQNPPVTSAQRQAAMRAKKQQLRDLLAEVGVATKSHASLRDLETLCRHRNVDIPTDTREEYVDNGASRKVSSRARVCVLNTLKDNTEYQYINNTVLNTHSIRGRADAREAAEAMRVACPDADAAHPLLASLLAAGATVGELRLAAHEASALRKGFRYALGIAENRRRDALAVDIAAAQAAEAHAAERAHWAEYFDRVTKTVPSTSTGNPPQPNAGRSSVDGSTT